MPHLFPGFSGFITSIVIGAGCWELNRRLKEDVDSYDLGPGSAAAYKPIMHRYLRLAEFMIGAASGSIVLIVGSSALHGQGVKLNWFYASPLILIAFSVVYGVGFMACQILTWEEALHNGNKQTPNRFALDQALGFSSLLCFIFGYIWLVFSATNTF